MGAVALIVGAKETEIKLAPDVLQSQEPHWADVVQRILSLCNTSPSGTVRITPDGRLLFKLPKREYTENLPGTLATLKGHLAGLSGQ